MAHVDVAAFTMAVHDNIAPRHLCWINMATSTSSCSSLGIGGKKIADASESADASDDSELTANGLLVNRRECDGGAAPPQRKATLMVPVLPSRSKMNRRRNIISQLIHQHPSYSSPSVSDITTSESNSQQSRSDVHLQTRVVSSHDRCTPCATASIGTRFTVEVVSHKEDEKEAKAHETSHDTLQDSFEDTATIICSGCDQDELEEVSLDPKWAEALRAISIRLASERAQQQQSSETVVWDTIVHSVSPVDVTEAVQATRERESPVNRSTPNIPALTDLQRTIQQATKSIGKFSLDADSEENNGDDISLSSFASDAHFVTKSFAEYKKRAPPPRRSLQDDPAPWSHGLEFFPKQMYFGASNNAAAHHREELNNDTLSVTSSLTCESYNSLVAPPKSSPGTMSLSKVVSDNERSCSNILEMGVTAPMLEASQKSHYNPELGPSSMVDCMNDTMKNTNASVTQRSSSKKQNAHLDNAQVIVATGENDIGRGNKRSAPSAKDDTLEAPRKSLLSFLTALGQNSRSRSCSRSRQNSHHNRSKSHCRSKSHGRSKSHNRSRSRARNHERGETEPATEPGTKPDEQPKHEEHTSYTLPQSSLLHETEQRMEETISQSLPREDYVPEESRTTLPNIATLDQPGERCPIAHPHYKLGDSACVEDMFVFPKSRQRRRGRTRRREANNDSAETLQSTSSSSDSDDREVGSSRSNECAVDIQRAIGQLRHLDAAFIRRSDGNWTYALVADGNEDEIRFVVNDRGCTKVVPKSLWMSHVRRIRVLSQRPGDRIAITGRPNREMQMYGRAQSCRGREKGRLASPSPTRWKSCDLKLPTTIVE